MATFRYISEAIVAELVGNGWSTYGLAEFERFKDDGSPLESAARVKGLSAALFAGDEAAQKGAIDLLYHWLDAHRDHPEAEVLRLRLALYLHQMRRYEDAIVQIEVLTQSDPASPASWCLLGNLYGYLSAFDKAIAAFKIAEGLKRNWPEPKLEALEVTLLKAIQMKDQQNEEFRRAASLAHSLVQDATTNRVRLVGTAYEAVARLISDPRYYLSVGHQDAKETVEKLRVEPGTETWNVVLLWVRIRRLPQFVPVNDIVSPARTAIFELLRVVQEKLGRPREKDLALAAEEAELRF